MSIVTKRAGPWEFTGPSDVDGVTITGDNCTAVVVEGVNKGEKHQGALRKNKIHGKGVYTWPDGERYEGDFKDGKADGEGVRTWPDGKRYEGEWKDDKIHGKGVYTWPSGQRYEGEFKDDKMSYGVYTYTDGSQALRTCDAVEKEVKTVKGMI